MSASDATHFSIGHTRFGAWGAVLGRVSNFWQRAVGRAHYDTLRIETVLDAPLVVLPTVFNPRLLLTGKYFAELIRERRIGHGTTVLDMGTGTGIGAIFAARHARKVIAVDLNPAAARCARINALLNGVERTVEVFEGDLFAPIPKERFDVILFNPPFIRGAPRDVRDYAWRSTDVVQRFAAELRDHLNVDGYALVLLSTFGNAPDYLDDFRGQNCDVSIYAQRTLLNETLTVLKITPPIGTPNSCEAQT